MEEKMSALIRDFAKYLLDRRSTRRELVLSYLESVSDTANRLAEIWRTILTNYQEGIDNPLKDSKLELKAFMLSNAGAGPQQMPVSVKLEEFSKQLSLDPHDELDAALIEILEPLSSPSLFRRRKPNTHRITPLYKLFEKHCGASRSQDLLTSLAIILRKRHVARHHVDKSIAKARRLIFLSDDNTPDDVKTLEDAVQIIEREAAALEVLVKTYKAMM